MGWISTYGLAGGGCGGVPWGDNGALKARLVLAVVHGDHRWEVVLLKHLIHHTLRSNQEHTTSQVCEEAMSL